MYDTVVGKTGSKYLVVAKSEQLDVTVKVSPTYITFHIYIHDGINETERETIIKYIEKLGFNHNTNYWSGRFMVNNKLHKLIVIGGILYALADVTEWITPWPHPVTIFSFM
jgi:hypothetical protein